MITIVHFPCTFQHFIERGVGSYNSPSDLLRKKNFTLHSHIFIKKEKLYLTFTYFNNFKHTSTPTFVIIQLHKICQDKNLRTVRNWLAMFRSSIFQAWGKKQFLMKNYNHVNESNRIYSEDAKHDMNVPLRSASLNIVKTLSLKNYNISKNAYE